MFFGGADTAYSTGGFSGGATLKLCAYTGTQLETACLTDNVTPGVTSDMTLVVSVPSGVAASTMVSFAPGVASVPGGETNGWRANATDDDSDTVVNDGCSQIGQEPETQRCDNANNDDVEEDFVWNDGCPMAGTAPETNEQCINYTNDDPGDDSKVNDGCPVDGQPDLEQGGLRENDTNDDVRDDAAGGGQKVNDGCPIVGAAAEAGAQCDNAIDDDPADDGATPKVNDGCYQYGFGGPEPELNECSGAVDDDIDGMPNDGCPGLGGPMTGAVVGKIRPVSKIGLSNSPCNQGLDETLPLMNATTDNSLPSLITSLPPGGASYEGLLEPFRDDGNGNYLPQHVDRYPAFLNKLFDPDRVGDINEDGDDFDTVGGVAENPGASLTDAYGTVEPLRPRARYSASMLVVQTEVHMIQLLVFNPGALAAFQPPHPLSDLGSAALGYPMVVVVNDPTSPPGPGSVTDTCTPAETRILLWGTTRDNPCTAATVTCSNSDVPCPSCGGNGSINNLPGLDESSTPVVCSGTNERGCVRYANPSTAGTHHFYVYQQSARDHDRDGIENQLDTCPTLTNVENPRTSAGPDNDMLDSACDPGPSTNVPNQDADYDPSLRDWVNAQDNCPLLVNGDQKESELITKWSVAAKRGGSRADGMGDVCDPSATAANGHFHSTWTVIAKCIGATDTDGDGWCNTEETAWGSSATDANKKPEHYDVVVALGLTHSGSGSYPTEMHAELGPYCLVVGDWDGDTYIHDGCPSVSGGSEQGAQCSNAVDDDLDTLGERPLSDGGRGPRDRFAMFKRAKRRLQRRLCRQ